MTWFLTKAWTDPDDSVDGVQTDDRLRRLATVAVLTTAMVGMAPIRTAAAAPDRGDGDDAVVLQDAVAASATGRTRVIVKADAPSVVDAVLAGTESAVVSELDAVPAVVADVDQAGLDALLTDPAVEAITLDREGSHALDVSTGVIASDRLNAAGVLGDGYDGSRHGRYEVAIIDSGVDGGHRAFTGRIAAEACFSIDGWCPNGRTSQAGPGAGDDCTYSAECAHGTHVAGIAAGRPYPGGNEGVARGAGIVAIQIGHRAACGSTFCWRFWVSDLDRALDGVLGMVADGRRIAAVNLSLTVFVHFASSAQCAAAFPVTHELTTRLASAGVAVVVAAGNDFVNGAVSFPACLPNAFAVSATDDGDQPAGFSNQGSLTDFWAPGVGIRAPVPGRTANAVLSGTSMAAPHVAGAFALLRECPGNRGPAAVAEDLGATGRRLTVGGVRRRRIDVLDAATRNVPNNDFRQAQGLPRTGTVDRADFNVCADRQRREPGPNSVENSVWFAWRPSRSGRVVISTTDRAGHRTTFDTELTVFAGRRLPSLRLVEHDDNGGAGARSRVVFRARAGTAYRIRVDGVNAENGWFNLHLRPRPTPPTCLTAQPRC